jgi:prepilin-type N-terminal cleavage/methylation domain-containing protein
MADAPATLPRHNLPRRDRHPGPSSRGFTLLEVILVLALLVAITMVAGTNLRGGFRQQRLRKAAEQVRVEWARARVQAIKTGRVQVFHHALQGNRFFSMPQASLDDPPVEVYGTPTSGLPQPTGQPAGFANPINPQLSTDLSSVRQQELPQGVLFLAVDVRFDQRSAIQLNQAADPNSLTQVMSGFDRTSTPVEQWGMPIYFFPDGTSSTAQLVLLNDRNEAITLYLRGLTGLARVGSVQGTDEFTRTGGQR